MTTDNFQQFLLLITPKVAPLYNHKTLTATSQTAMPLQEAKLCHCFLMIIMSKKLSKSQRDITLFCKSKNNLQSLQNSPCSLTQQMCNQDTLLLLLSSHFNSFPPHYHHSLRPSKFLALIGIHLSLFSQLCTLIQSNHSSMQT